MPITYPMDRLTCMSKDGPPDRRFHVPEGELQYHSERDARFPYIYRIPKHALVHSPDHIKIILIHIVDTSAEARVERAQFEKTLSVPLGPNELMDKYGASVSILFSCHLTT